MKKQKTKIILILVTLLMLVMIFALLPKKEKQQDEVVPVDKETLIPINWKDLIEVEVHGTEDDNYITITYVKEIPHLKEKIKSEFEKWNDSTERNEEGLNRLTEIQNLENRFDFCHTKEDYKHLEKDSEFIIVCEDKLLEELGYVFEREYQYKATGIEATISPEKNEPEEKINEEQRIYEQNRAMEPVYGVYAAGDLLWVDVYNINGFELDNEKSVQYKHTILHILFEEDLEKALEYAKGNPNVDFVKYEDFAYTKDKNFEGGRAWYGVPIY